MKPFHCCSVLLVQLSVQTTAAPQFTVDLDMPARQRWREVARVPEYNAYLELSRGIAEITGNVFSERRGKPFADAANISQEYREEMQGYLEAMESPSMTLDFLIMYNIGYELGTSLGCYGSLAAMPNGTMVHGRNMDMEAPWLENLTFEVTFVRSGQPLFTSVHWPGAVGITTAMRYGGWTFEQNTRLVHNNASLNLAALRQGMEPFSFAARRVMEQTADFGTAVRAFTSIHFAAPQYFVVAGSQPYEGAVITLDRGGRRLSSTPPVQFVEKGVQEWFVVQSNDDPLGPPMDSRRAAGKKSLRAVGQQRVSIDSITRVMQTEPVFNNWTRYSWVASPSLGTHVLKLRQESLDEKASGAPRAYLVTRLLS